MRNGVTIGVQHDAATGVGGDGADDSAVIGPGRQGTQQRLFLEEAFDRFAAGLAVNADVGDGVQPLAGGGIDGGKGRDVQAVEKVLFDIADAVLDAAFFISLGHLAGHRGKSVMGGEVQVTGIKPGRFSAWMLQHPHLQVVNHHFQGRAAHIFHGAAVAGKEVLHASMTVNSTYIRRLWQSTMTKKLKRRRVDPTATEPRLPQSTWAHSPGANSSIRKAGLRTGRTSRTYSCRGASKSRKLRARKSGIISAPIAGGLQTDILCGCLSGG